MSNPLWGQGVTGLTLSLALALSANACAGAVPLARQRPDADAQPPAPAGYAEAVQGTSTPPDPHRVRRIYGYVSLAIGAEAAVIAVVTSFLLLLEKSALVGECDAQKRCSRTSVAETGAIQQTVPWNTTSWIVAVAGLGAGTILLLTSAPESSKSTALTVSPNPGGAALGLRSTF